ncbi:regulator of (H+)-ATPase in vacuolar membrane [Coemansia spiralis]|uniref:Regulator of (H+)-ATPase in vacuolar membrane n=1 Tax=Coemansia spiralis TaxID=417178 RepID=A0A9W8G7A6_9FUNG|nr:regulator of (H+)-ATPase in vacuolar membrane [Coemansia spiralis]
MMQCNIYPGRANENTLISIYVSGKLYIAYASGTVIIVYSSDDRFVQSFSHANIAVNITALDSGSSTGRIAAIAGSSVVLFSPNVSKLDTISTNEGCGSNGTRDSSVCWEFTGSLSLDQWVHDGDRVSNCKWLSDNQLIISINSALFLWTQTDEDWNLSWSQENSGHIDIIEPLFGTAIFATASYDCQLTKIWQVFESERGVRVRFQYVVHPNLVCCIFWKQQLPVIIPTNKMLPIDDLALYTISHSGCLYVWNSNLADDYARPRNAQYGIRFMLSKTINLIDSVQHSHSRGNNVSKALVSVGITLQIDEYYREEGDKAASDHNSSSENRSDNKGDVQIGGTAKEQVGARSDSNAAVSDKTHIRARGDFIYAIYNDGSLALWETSRQTSSCSIYNAEKVLQTSTLPVNASLISEANQTSALLSSLSWHSTKMQRLAVSDNVGHVYLFDLPHKTVDTIGYSPLYLRDLWDGHRENIFHISVDPYSQRLATHSVEGELLIWETIGSAQQQQQQQPLLISRKMALDGTQIRIIAWAPAKSEFIAATDKQVYRLVYDSNKEQWTPSDSSLPNIKPYDRIFTYPTEISDFDESTQDQQSYFISTVSKESRTIQTWRVAASNKMIEYIGSLNLKNDARFDLASRVMPAPYPFFSLDNIMATFDTSTGKLRIWGIRAKPRFVWFCSKEHLLPCMNVKMIRYNSIDKAAIVSMEEDGSQIITVWVFSSASRESHYLPAGTIYPRKKTDCVREIRWHFTDYAQTYLGIQWDDRVDVYCQERNLDNAWRCIFTISSTDFGLKKEIGSFSFTSLGEPTFSVENQLFICSQSVPSSGKLISDITFEHHGELPLIHPFVLTELLSWGKMDVVQRLLSLMYDYMRRLELDRNCNASLPMISIHDLISADGTDGRNLSRSAANTKTNNLSKYSGLFASEEPSSIVRLDTSEPDFERFDSEKADYLLEKLTEIKIKGISAIEQSRLMSIVGTISAGLAKDHPLDEMGMRYLLKLHLLELENKRTRSSSELSYRELNWAMYSNSQAILLQICLQQHATTGLTWELARRMGLFMWLSDTSVLHAEVEKMARNIFVADGRDPTKCAIFYLALKKQRLLHGLWRTANSHPDQSKMLAFLFHDFSEARWKTAAAKNAYVLLSKQRYFDAATFFMLSDKLADAATICITQLKDVQLAITICRCYEGENGPVLRDLIWKHVLPDAFKRQDRWLASLAFGIIQKYDLVLRSLTDDLSKLSSQIGVAAEVSSYSAMNVADTELLILYRNMLSHSPHYRAPLVVQAQLIASTITIFECLGVPIMALVVLEWWRKELYDITKKSVLSAKPPSSTPATELIDKSISTGVPDMSAFGGFSKYAPASSGSNSNSKSLMSSSTADPLASGMLSMDSFGPMFSGISVSASRPSKRPSGQGNLANGTQASLNSTSNAQHTMHRSSDSNGADSDSDNVTDDATLAMDIEDTPVQYACRVMLALQIADYVRRICDGTNESVALDNINLEAEKQTIAETLRLPLTIFPS